MGKRRGVMIVKVNSLPEFGLRVGDMLQIGRVRYVILEIHRIKEPRLAAVAYLYMKRPKGRRVYEVYVYRDGSFSSVHTVPFLRAW